MYRYSANETEKISNELLNEIYPMETLNKYYFLGYAQALRTLMSFIETHVDNTKEESVDAKSLIDLIVELAGSDEILKRYYSRLRKEDNPTELEYRIARLRRLRQERYEMKNR